jgi:hypothetical protein
LFWFGVGRAMRLQLRGVAMVWCLKTTLWVMREIAKSSFPLENFEMHFCNNSLQRFSQLKFDWLK